MTNEDLKYAIALSSLHGVGSIHAKKLLAYAGGYAAVFSLSYKDLLKIEGIGTILAKNLTEQFTDKKLWHRVNEELVFIENNDLTYYLYKSTNYPTNLTQCEDAPIVLFSRGKINFNSKKILSIVGTRNITPYGKAICDQIIQDFANTDVLIISGLAYGVDTAAHKAAVKHNIQTIGVLAHGLDRIYPATNKNLAKEMLLNGGLLTEFLSKTNPDRENFPKRNRIIAGIADATLVIESANKGGSLITAEIANSYSRDVFAIPGRVGDEKSEGCNYLIQNNKAHLVTSAKQIIQFMGWEEKRSASVQKSLFIDLNQEEQTIINCLQKEGKLPIDSIAHRTNLAIGILPITLLDLEFKGLIRSLPGKQYELC